MEAIQRFFQTRYLLLAIAAAIAAIHLALINRTENTEFFALVALFWMTAGTLLWDKKDTLELESRPGASAIGLLLLLLILLPGMRLSSSNAFLHLFPLVALFGLALLASGVSGLKQYWKELAVFGLLSLQPLVMMVLQVMNLPVLTAKAGGFLLHYSGFKVQRDGVFLILPTGRVEVYGACAGFESILLMLSVSFLFLMLVPLRRSQAILAVLAGIFIGFFTNAIRVMLLALLVAYPNLGNFEFWHEGQGSLIFSVISVALFGGFCWLAFLRTPQKADPEEDLSTYG